MCSDCGGIKKRGASALELQRLVLGHKWGTLTPHPPTKSGGGGLPEHDRTKLGVGQAGSVPFGGKIMPFQCVPVTRVDYASKQGVSRYKGMTRPKGMQVANGPEVHDR